MFREKNTNESHMENDIFPKVRKCPYNIDGMLNILQKKDIFVISDLCKN